MTLNSRLYDILKPIALIYLPALATLYFAIASIWGIPDTTSVIGTISAADTFLGAVLGLSSKSYTQPLDGVIVSDGTDFTKVDIQKTHSELQNSKTVTLAIQQTSPASSPK